MTLAFKDFPPARKLLGFSTGPFESCLIAANSWIASEGAQVVNVETLGEEGIRVWYQKD